VAFFVGATRPTKRPSIQEERSKNTSAAIDELIVLYILNGVAVQSGSIVNVESLAGHGHATRPSYPK
jgi:hypothetical protein